MVYKPKYLSSRAFNLFLLSILPPFLVAAIGAKPGDNVRNLFFFIIGCILSYRFIISRFSEKVTITQDELIIERPFAKAFRYKIKSLKEIFVTVRIARIIMIYTIFINCSECYDDITAYNSKNHLSLYGPWYESQLNEILKELKTKNSKLKIIGIIK